MSVLVQRPTPLPLPLSNSPPNYTSSPLPRPKTPRTPSRPPSSPLASASALHEPRPPSRSERLLRDTLLRDEMERTQPLPTPRAQRRHSHQNPPASANQLRSPSGPPLTPSRGGLGRNKSLTTPSASPSSSRGYVVESPSKPYHRNASPTPGGGRTTNLQRLPIPDSSYPYTSPPSPVVQPQGHNISSRRNSISSQRSSHSQPPSPIHTHHTHMPSQLNVSMGGMTPHEQVLRTRLERVLTAGKREESKERQRERKISQGGHQGSGWLWSGGANSESDPFGGSRMPVATRVRTKTDPTPTEVTRDPAYLQRHHTSPPATLPSSPQLPTLGFSRTHSPARSRSQSQSQAGSKDNTPSSQAWTNGPLTPPPTPPTTSSHLAQYPTHTRSNTSESDFSHSHSSNSRSHNYQQQFPSAPPPTSASNTFPALSASNYPATPSYPSSHHQAFNARTASAQCRKIDGYVSFAAVEGLGEPEVDGDEEREEDAKRGRGRGRSVFGRILGVWS